VDCRRLVGMWSKVSGFFGSPKSAKGCAYQATTDALSLEVIVHCFFHDAASEAIEDVADCVSREFAFGTNALRFSGFVTVDDALRSKLMESPLFSTQLPDDEECELPPETNEGADRVRQLLSGMYADMMALHRFAVREASNSGTAHIVLLCPKPAASFVLSGLRRVSLPLVCVEASKSNSTKSERPVKLRTGIVCIASAEATYATRSDDDDQFSDQEQDSGHISNQIAVSPTALQEASTTCDFINKLRRRILRQGHRTRGDSAVVSIETSSAADEEMGIGALSTSTSSWEVMRLGREQLHVLKTIAVNLHNTDVGGASSHMYKSINAASERFEEVLGRVPAAMRVLRNLGFTAPSSRGALEYAAHPILECFRKQDRHRTIAQLEKTLGTQLPSQ
jgi:hypothetical protein